MATTKKKTKTNEATALETTTGNTAIEDTSFDFGEDENSGYDPESSDDVLIPRINVLQALSPQCEEINEAKPGLLFNTVSKELSSEVYFVPAKTEKCYNEWTPRDQGGGFVARHEVGDEIVQRLKRATPKGKLKTETGNELVETRYIYCAILDSDLQPTGSFAVIDFTSTKLAAFKQWNTIILYHTVRNAKNQRVRPPLFSHLVKLTTRKQENKHGSFHNFVLSPANGSLIESVVNQSHPAYQAGKELRSMIDAGAAKMESESSTSSNREQEEVPDEIF